jgi:hypothetical protein
MPTVKRSPGNHFSIKQSCLEFPYQFNQTRPPGWRSASRACRGAIGPDDKLSGL